MTHEILDAVLRRAESAKSESDFAYFFSLLLAGEALFKTTVLGFLSSLTDDRDRNRYRLEHSLVRADGLGEWGRALDDALTGTASQYLLAEARSEQTELTRNCKPGDWQYDSVLRLKEALNELGIESEDLPVKSDMKRWFRLFVTLRNKTRGHGATLPGKAGKASAFLRDSIDLFYQNHSLFQRSWVFLHRNLSGKYRASPISEENQSFDFLKKEATHSLADGVYIFIGAPRAVPLLKSDPELHDFFFANGGLKAKTHELLSYTTDDKVEGDATGYLIPPGTLPPSETEGHGELLPQGKCLSNAPDVAQDYVPRPELEASLTQLLLDDKRLIVTLVGRGGIGKTSLALKVISILQEKTRYEVVVWFSARDIDLQISGPKPVRQLVLSPEDVSSYYASLVLQPEGVKKKGFNARAFFEQQIQKNELGPCLYIFDNFETTQNPIELFNWIDAFVRHPNKVLITTRLRNFKGDYPLDVPGMMDEEARLLVKQTAHRLGIEGVLTSEYVGELILESSGHPYVIKVLLGEVANTGRISNIRRVVAGSDEILVALFERTYASLTPCAQKAFLTLAAWNSSVPRVALEAVLLRSTPERIEVEKGVDSLLHYSMAETHLSPIDKQEFVGLPLVATEFGRKKLNVSPSKTAIQADVEVLQMLGPSQQSDIHLGLLKRVGNFISNLSRQRDAGRNIDDYLPIVEMICRSYHPAWLQLAKFYIEGGSTDELELGKVAIRHFLEIEPSSENAAGAWQMLAEVCRRTGDAMGEIHAFVERIQIRSVSFYDISSTANRLNGLLREHILPVDRDEKRILAQRIVTVMDRRRKEADADDLSRMAWLSFHTGQEVKAREYVALGLELEPENEYCRRLAEKLGIAT